MKEKWGKDFYRRYVKFPGPYGATVRNSLYLLAGKKSTTLIWEKDHCECPPQFTEYWIKEDKDDKFLILQCSFYGNLKPEVTAWFGGDTLEMAQLRLADLVSRDLNKNSTPETDEDICEIIMSQFLFQKY
jgi:hypothetical protein